MPPKRTRPKEPLVAPDLNGTVPGVLDHSQPSRLLRRPDSTLSFASFDPHAAAPYTFTISGGLSSKDSWSPKRIVIETVPGVGSYWRWVPRARLRSHVQDEGIFPRLVNVCGHLFNISQEQWDIHKLDPAYDCFVDDFSLFSVISKKDTPSYEGFNHNTGSSAWPGSSSARQTPDSQSDMDMEVDDSNDPNFRRRPKRRHRSKRTPPFAFNFTATPGAGITSPPSSSSKKRNAYVSFQSLRDPEEEEKAYFEQDNKNRNTTQFSPHDKKRSRTMSPSTSQRAAHSHSKHREKEKRKKIQKEKAESIKQRHQKMERDALADIPESAYFGNNHSFEDIPEDEEPDVEIFDAPPWQPDANEEEELAQAWRIAESLRKMDELNADREYQRRREKFLRAENDKRAQTEEPLSAGERALREKEKQNAEKRQAAALKREEGLSKWDRGQWDDYRAIERFLSVSKEFEKTEFNPDTLPLTFIDFPWPTLRHPRQLTVEDISWLSVKEFFDAARRTLRPQKFKELVKTRRFQGHPDQFNKRRISIIDERERNEIGTAVTLASQVVNDLWNEIQGT